ncbi:uncharacterized protein LOC124871471 isoform X2 [Girardinichthys multiradiatus]|uniref:uncharacterized protein LOC124871471 isoform X2 n=1 Tax=Girardinichthys multiradiatus TaxID=208333 RepID=UPI001FAC9522|nr:uncharacterized protein LOC124871471 isoform X2 [Girardinichthys multiradiatus]
MDRPEDPSSSASEKMPEGDKMDDCGSPEEMDVSTEENIEGGNQAGGPTGEPPSQVNQAKNRSAAMATDTQPGGGKKPKPSSEKSRRSIDLQAEETGRCSMKCPKCKFQFVPFVKFIKKKNEQGEFSIDLHTESKDTLFFTDKLACQKQAPDTKVNCPNCKYSFLYKRVATSVNNNMGGFDINLSINIPEEVQQQGRTGDDQPASKGASGMQSVNEVQEEQGMEQDHPKPSAEPTGSKTDESSSGFFQELWNRFPAMNSFKSKTSEWSNPTIKVCCINTAEAFDADVAFMKAVKNNKGKSPKVEETSVDECSLIIIFCPVSLCRTSDVKSAMENTRVSSSGKPVILVLMHHTRDVDYSTAGFNWCEELKNVVLPVHVFYHDSVNGLLECRQNTEAIEAIQQELLKYKQ